MSFSLKKVPIWKRRRAPQSDEMALQITSMADIFVILLVFLLKSYSSSSVAIQTSAGTRLPAGHPADINIEALRVEVTEGVVLVEGQPAAQLNGYAFNPADVGSGGVSQSLSAVLEKERKRQLLIAQSNSDVKVDPKIIVVADQRVPYSTIKGVLASAALNGYTDFKLAVAKEE